MLALTDGQVFVFAGIAALLLGAVLEHAYKVRQRRRKPSWAVVTEQDGAEHVVSLTGLVEAADWLDLEEQLHARAGWTVDRYGATMRAAKGGTVRWIWIRPT